MKLIVFTGPPASGKSSLSSDIAKDLKIDCISKDLFKIHLFDKYGFKNHDEKKLLSIKGEAMMYRVIKFYISRNKDLIIDNNFKEFDTLRILLNANNQVELFCVVCMADYKILATRYNKRIQEGKRHLGLSTTNYFPYITGISNLHKPITEDDVSNIQKNVLENSVGDNVLHLNTNHIETDYINLYNQVKKYISKGEADLIEL